jgi:hypothetical protein
MHHNLFGLGHSPRDVYAKLQEDSKRDQRTRMIFNIVFCASVWFLARGLGTWDQFGALIAAWSGMAGIQYFIDESNRNFWMHQLDWAANERSSTE